MNLINRAITHPLMPWWIASMVAAMIGDLIRPSLAAVMLYIIAVMLALYVFVNGLRRIIGGQNEQ